MNDKIIIYVPIYIHKLYIINFVFQISLKESNCILIKIQFPSIKISLINNLNGNKLP